MLPRNFGNIFGRIPGPIITLPETDIFAPMEKEMEMNSETMIFRGKLLKEANFSILFRRFSELFVGPGTSIGSLWKKVRYQHLHFVPCKPPPLHRSMSAVKIFLFHLQSWQKTLCWIEVLGEMEANVTNNRNGS